MRVVWSVSVLLLALSVACGGSSGNNSGGKAAAPTTSSADNAAANGALAACAKDPRCAAAQTNARDQMAAAGKKACTLVTQAEAATTLGKPVGLGAIQGSNCKYEDPQTSYSVTIDVRPTMQGGSSAKALFDAAHKAGAGSLTAADDVAGLGDGAFIWTGLGTIHVISGATYFSIQVANALTLSNQTAEQRPVLIALARKALTRL
jgi:hypothetical protein